MKYTCFTQTLAYDYIQHKGELSGDESEELILYVTEGK